MNNDREPLVTNANSASQAKRAEIKEKDIRRQELDDIKHVMSSVQGRRFVYKLLSEFKAMRSIYDSSGSKTYYNAGKQDCGHYVIAEVSEADGASYFKMLDENK